MINKIYFAELGFIKFNKQVNTINLNNEETITKSKEKTISKQQQVEIEQIKEMFDIGALTKDEYDAAIKRVLN